MQPSFPRQFVTTRWSLVLEAGTRSAPDADQALESLCRAYWFPLYAFARRRGYQCDDAADRTQEFFSCLIDKSFLESADPAKGRFRTFLLTIFQRFLVNEHERNNAVRRGGGRLHFSLDVSEGETRYQDCMINSESPERIFEREWALTLLDRVIKQMQDEYSAKNKSDLFDECREFLIGSDSGRYDELAARLRMSEAALRVAVHRMRERYKDLLRREIAETLAGPSSIDDELNELRRAIRGDH
jgi:DNA-directed RNA polymerase specialized sigma24 family protein